MFKIVPVLNPDGVVLGNNRCSLAGVDLNRQWRRPNKAQHPTVFHCKQLARELHATHGVALACDIHNHSRRHHAFLYGCDPRMGPRAPRETGGHNQGGEVEHRDPTRQFAERLASVVGAEGVFSAADCSFVVRKVGTAGQKAAVRLVPHQFWLAGQGRHSARGPVPGAWH